MEYRLDYEKVLSNSVDLMKKNSERAAVQYLSISAIAWQWWRQLHVLRGLYGSGGHHGGGAAIAVAAAVVEARYRLFTCT